MIKGRKVGNPEAYREIDSLVEKFPYASALQVLKAIARKESDDLQYKAQLSRAAIAIPDRELLYEILVRDAVLESIEKADSEIHEAEIAETSPTAELKESPTVDGNEKEPEPQASSHKLSETPVEEEIMRAAVMQLGELETEYALSNYSISETVQAEKPKVQNTPKTFGEWLLALDGKSESSPPRGDLAIIDKFIQENPQITPVKKAFFSPSQMGKMSLVDDESFVTETLASIYEKQGDFKKAARAYQNLGLKYPEKRTYFAALQKQAEENLKS